MERILFTNNASSTLSATLTIAATSATVATGGGAKFPSPGTREYSLLRIGYDDNNEIVKLTARSTDTLTIARAQEGTTAKEWPSNTPIGVYITAAQANSWLPTHDSGDTLGVNALDIQSGSDQTPNTGYAATGTRATAIGFAPWASGQDCIALGSWNFCGSQDGISIGNVASVDPGATAAIAIGEGSWIDDNATYSIAIGRSARVTTGLTGSIALGHRAYSELKLGLCCNTIWYARATTGAHVDFDYRYPAASTYIFSQDINLTQTATDNIVNFAIPTGSHFYVEELGMTIESATSVTVFPTISFGNTGATQALLATVATTKNTIRQRETWTPLTIDGQSEITASLKSSATATTLTGRFYLKGILVQD